MATPNDLNDIIDRIAAKKHTTEDLQILRREIIVSSNSDVVQVGKYNVNIAEAKDIHVGDRIYEGPSAEAIQNILRQILNEYESLFTISERGKPLSILSSDWLANYLQHVENEFVDHMCEVEETSNEKVINRYVELLVQERVKLEEQKKYSGRKLREEPLSQFVVQSGIRLLVFGEGGSGKTTSLLKLAADAATSVRANSNSPIPIYVKLNYFDTKENGFERLLEILGNATSLDKQEIKKLWLQDKQPLLLLLDGFNEVGQEFLESCVLALKEFMTTKPHRYVVTSRPTVDAERLAKQIEGVKVLDILQLSDKQMQSFLERHDSGELYERIGIQLKGLVRNPFMLWALIQSCVGLPKGQLPSNRGQLYQNFIDRYIFSEREEKKIPPQTLYDYRRVKQRILSQLAYQMMVQTKTRILLDEQLENEIFGQLQHINEESVRLKRVMPNNWSVEDFLNEITSNGILRRFRNTLEFMHQSVQSYFAAVYLENVGFSHASFHECCQHIAWEKPDNNWDEVIELLAGLTAHLNHLVSQLVERDHFLAALCAGVRPTDISPTVTNYLFESIIHFDIESTDISIGLYSSWWEKVITAYEKVLILTENGSIYWAVLQADLGFAYAKRILEPVASNLEQAIQYFKAALKVFNYEEAPERWARIQNNLGNVYRERIRKNPVENLDKALTCYRSALQVYTFKTFPKDWAITQRNLGNAYRERIRGEKAENLEVAIEYYNNALRIFTQDAFPRQWAETQKELGNAYRERIRGEKAENLEVAIEYYNNALRIFTQDAFPRQWAETQKELGNAYRERIRGEKAENLEVAIEYYNNALRIFTQDAFPRQWAETQKELGNAYRERIRGEKAENLEVAIEYYNNALRIFTQDAFPRQWAETQKELGNAYRERIRGEKAENLEVAIEYYNNALRVFTRDIFPRRWIEVKWNLGVSYQKAQNFPDAYNSYAVAIETVELLRSEIVFGSGREEDKTKLAEEWNQIYYQMVKVCLRLGYHKHALEYVDCSKTRNLLEYIFIRNPESIYPLEFTKQLRDLQEKITDYQGRLQIGIGDNLSELAECLKSLRQQFIDLQDRYLPIGSSFKLDKFLKTLDNRTALIEWYISQENLYAFIITCHSSELVILSTDTNELNALKDWVNLYLESYAQNKDEWRKELGHQLAELARLLRLDNIKSNLSEICDQLILVPHLFLHLLPLHIIPISEEVWLSDCFPRGVKYSPSLQLLQLLSIRERSSFNNFLAVQDPTGRLTWTQVEVQAIAGYFNNHMILSSSIKESIFKEASDAHIVHFACPYYFNSSEPRKSALILDKNAYLDLEQLDLGKCLTLEEIFSLRLNQCRLVVLSGNETGLVDIRSVSDEYVGLPSGFLAAGSNSVISSLWTVHDLSTALLMVRFYDLLQQAQLSPALALTQAQNWLRHANKTELQEWIESRELPLTPTIRLHLRRYLYQLQNYERPLKDPFYWAAFCFIGL